MRRRLTVGTGVVAAAGCAVVAETARQYMMAEAAPGTTHAKDDHTLNECLFAAIIAMSTVENNAKQSERTGRSD